MDSEKVVLGLGNYGYDWQITLDKQGNEIADRPATPLSFGAALNLAREDEIPIEMDPTERNPYFYYSDQDNKEHVVYMLDAVTAYNEIMALKGYRPRGVAVWRLGAEDPSIWSFFNEDNLGKPIIHSRSLEHVSDGGVVFNGRGEMTEVIKRPVAGIRILKTDADGLIESERYKTYPNPYIIQCFGGENPKDIALTFDDGPDSLYTPSILDILKKYKVHGTFFIVGENAENNTGILSRIWREGNEIGNHTYTHPYITAVSPLRAELEVNSTQRLIESITGHSTRLFRPPYGDAADTDNATAEVAELRLRMQRLGYICVGMHVDPEDYAQVDKPISDGTADIIHGIKTQLKLTADTENIILLHDGGGDRSRTVAALSRIIPDLQNEGYRFVTVSELLGKDGHARMFPGVGGATAINGLDKAVFEGGFVFSHALQIVFFVSIFLGVLRIAIVAPLAIVQNRRNRASKKVSAFSPPVTVIIPAYNEEKVICRTIQSVLDNDYPDFRIIVVDDGSTDGTADIVSRSFSSQEDRLTLLCKENGGKATALNLAISDADTEIIVCLDADTIFAKDAISKLVQHFQDPRVGAVAGNVKVGNRDNPLTIWQSVEYITSQNFDRRAYAALNSVPVVPGAIGAWRKSAVLEAGGYHANTLAEDTDLTFRIRLLGYNIQTENEALSYTEVPDTVASLAKQRFRWSFGILQSPWKHRDALFQPNRSSAMD